MAKKYHSKALGAVHEAMQGLHRLGLLDTKTVREFDDVCLTLVGKLTPEPIAERRNEAKNIRMGRH